MYWKTPKKRIQCRPEGDQLVLRSSAVESRLQINGLKSRARATHYPPRPILCQAWLRQNYILTWKKLLTSPPPSHSCCPASHLGPIQPRFNSQNHFNYFSVPPQNHSSNCTPIIILCFVMQQGCFTWTCLTAVRGRVPSDLSSVAQAWETLVCESVCVRVSLIFSCFV